MGKNRMIKPGDIGFSSNWQKGLSGLLATLIRYFTKSKISHTLLIQNPLGESLTTQEASSIVQVVSFDHHYRDPAQLQSYSVYRVKASEEAKQASLKKVFDEFAGVTYGKLQLIWFVYRAFNERILRRDVRKQKNWMSDGVICSELVYWYLWYLGEPYQTLLAPWNPDTIQAQDLLNIVLTHPELFELIEEKAQ
jgi:hypothetical protein